jgi:hypothetical protein
MPGFKIVQTLVDPPIATLDEASWQAWLGKGRVQGHRSAAKRILAVKLVSIAALLTRGMLGAQSSPYEVALQCAAAAGAAIMMIQSLHLKRYAFAAAFGAVLLAYNPIAVAFSLPADLQQSLVLMCAIPFAASLTWRDERLA